MTKKKVTRAAAIMAAIGAAALALGYFRGDPDLDKAKALASSLSNADPAQRKERWQDLRKALDKLPPEKRRLAMEGMREDFQKREREEMRRYFALSPKDRVAYLDKRIMESEKRRQQWAAKAQTKPAGGGNSNNSNNNSNNNRGGQGGGRPAMTAEQRDQARKQRLDNSSPEDRAQRAEFRRQMDQRRQQLGLATGGGGGGWRGR